MVRYSVVLLIVSAFFASNVHADILAYRQNGAFHAVSDAGKILVSGDYNVSEYFISGTILAYKKYNNFYAISESGKVLVEGAFGVSEFKIGQGTKTTE
jgi:hypothetical protein